MTPTKSPEKRSASERLKEVEDLMLDYSRPNSTTDGGNLYAVMPWLIVRVKRLEAALEIYAMTNETFPEYGDVARKALEDS